MKKFILAALIGATIMTPIAVSAQERQRGAGRSGGGEARQQMRSERQAPRQEQRQAAPQQPRQIAPQQRTPQQTRQFYGGRGQRSEQAPQQRPATPQVVEQRRDFRQDRQGARQDFRQERREDRRDLRQGQVTPQQFREDRRGDRQDFRQDGRGDRQGFRQDRRDDRQGFRQDRRDDRRGVRQDPRRYGNGYNQQQYRGNRGDNRHWNRGWRGDRRYDWSSYRNSNRHIYRLPRYYAPSGWGYGYRRFSVGLTLGAMLFSSNYWINDPYYYRLPPADGPYRWVRYYNDALLVDIDSGEVVDIEYDIFW